MKSSLPVVVGVAVAVVVLGVIIYVATHWSEIQDRFFSDHSKTNTEGTKDSTAGSGNGSAGTGNDSASGNSGGTGAANGGKNNSGSNQGLNYNNAGKPSPDVINGQAHDQAAPPKIVNGEDPSSPCPTQTNKYKRVLPCPKVPASVKDILKKQNVTITTKDDCEIETRTTKITTGKKFIAWTVSQTNSCENKAYPQGLSEEHTYVLADGAEVNWPDHFDLKKLEKYFLANVDLSSGIDENGERCQKAKDSNRKKNLGSLNSDLTKAQFRFVDNNNSIKLVIQSFMASERGTVCSLQTVIKDWPSMLLKDSKFQKNQKPGQIGDGEE